jgi:CubicO group peptidase (beta-lactamase class C family)
MPTLKSRDLLLRTALGLLLLSGCAGSGGRSGADTADDWILGGAAEAGFDPAALERLVLDIEAGMFPNTHALLIEHDGALVFERHFSGSDERWGQPIPARVIGPDSLHDLRSVSKSVTSTLLGIVLADDFGEAVARPVTDLSMARHVEEIGDWSDDGVWGYGYQWWVGDLPTGVRVVAGVGNGNQRLFVIPAERLVITVLAGEYNVFEGHSERILDRVLAAR